MILFCQNPKRKVSISRSNFDEQLPKLLFTYLCLFVKVLRVVAAAEFQSASGVYYFLV